MPRTLKITGTETVTVRESSPELLEVEGNWAPGAGEPPKHFHPDQDEHFEVLAGRLQANVDGQKRTLAAGDTLDIPRGAVHQMWDPDDEPARAIWQTRPRGRTEQWFEAIDALHRQGRVGRNGMPGPLAFGVLLTEYRDVFRLAAGPDAALRPLLALLGAIGRQRGYSATAR
jgi:quercetin dioxygenase-like cupin family protein